MYKVVLCRALHPNAMARLAERKDVELKVLTDAFRGPPMEKELAAAIGDADGIMVGLERVTDALLAGAPKLRVISRFGVGYDTVDIPACTRRGVVVGVTNGANDLSVAEHAMMLMLAVARRTVEIDAVGARRHLDARATAGRWTNSPAAPSWWSATAASAPASRACARRSACT